MLNQLPTDIMQIIFNFNREEARKEKQQNIYSFNVLQELQEFTENIKIDSGGGYDMLEPSTHTHILHRIRHAKSDPFADFLDI